MTTDETLVGLRQQNSALQRRVAELEFQLKHQGGGAMARLNIMLEMTAALLVTRDTEAVLTVAAEQTRALVPGTVQTLIYLLGGDGRLRLRHASDATPSDEVVTPLRGIAGRAFAAPRAMLIAGPELFAALAEHEPAQEQQLQGLLGADWPPLCALAAPLRLETQRLGAVVLYGGTEAHLFHPRDLQFVEALAHLISVVLNDALQRERAAVLQHDLDHSRRGQAEAQARLDAIQARLLQSAKLAAVGELAASVAHEINNPLYAARNSLYLVDRKLPADAPQRQFLDIAQSELGRIARIVGRMRDFYRPTRAELTPTDLNALLEETLGLVGTHMRHGSVVVVADLSPAMPHLVVSADQMRQVFLNIVLNACDAMSGGGTLRVTTRLSPPEAADEPGGAVPASYTISFEDSGGGIAPDVLPHLFEPFYTTKAQGTGLGLAISAHIVNQHGGTIGVDTELGVGTTFSIVLPCAGPREPAVDPDVAPFLLHQLDSSLGE